MYRPLNLFHLTALLLCLWANTLNGQNITDDAAARDSLKEAFRCVYNFEFERADDLVLPLAKKYPDHPALVLYRCVHSFWKYYPIINHASQYEWYKKELERVIALSEPRLQKKANNPEANYLCLLGHLMLSRHWADDGESLKAVNHARKSYPFIKRGFELRDRFPDYYFTTGIYNYYREFYPEMHPIYKPFLSFFPPGNKALGLIQLGIGADESYFSRAEALVFACFIHLRYENNPEKALYYAAQLNADFPNNPVFRVIYAETLLMNQKYERAIPVVNQIIKNSHKYFLLPAALFKAIIEEKYLKKEEQAKEGYLKAINIAKGLKKSGENYAGLAYYYLGCIENSKGKTELAKSYFKKAGELCHYVKVKTEAKNYLEKK
jgi:hypothetical protein